MIVIFNASLTTHTISKIYFCFITIIEIDQLMRYLIILILASFSLIGCENYSTSKDSSAFFGGEIINPKGESIIFYNQKENINDTLFLDENNRFSHKLTNFKPGIYSFRYGSEIQFVILEPEDSLMIRINTYDFDESLVFTGKGSRKNNYLIKTFLLNESKEENLVQISQKDPEEFNSFVTKRHKDELNDFYKFTQKKAISPLAVSIIKAKINYHNYSDKEIYPFAYFGENKMVHIKDLPEDFYNYRKNIDYNANELSEIFSYNRFLFFHFDNLALIDYYKNNPYHSRFNRHELSYNKTKLVLIDSLVKDTTLKNSLLKYKTREFINHSNDESQINDIMALYTSKTTNEKDVAYMTNLITSLNSLKPGKGLPELKLFNTSNEEYTIGEIVNKPTLIYFWSTNVKKHYTNSHYRAKELKAQFPEISFISININDNSEKYWKETLDQYKFDLKNEYRFKNPKQALESLAVNYLWKVIVVDKNSQIIHPNANIFSDDFEITLKELLQKKELTL